MKRILKIFLWLVAIIVVGIGGIVVYIVTMLPNIPLEQIHVESTPSRLERGRYLAHSVAACMDCHSERNWNKFAGPLVDGTLGQGGEEFNQKLGFPGRYVAGNITPYGIGSWSDAELFRAITSGVSKNGKALFPVMPHPNYGRLDKEDIYSIMAYIRSLQPVQHDIPASSSNFPMNIIIHTIPQKSQFGKIPDKNDKVNYGKYLLTAASCRDCHTQQNKGKPVEGMDLAGGFAFPLLTGGTVRSANITPDKETGIGTWTESDFVSRFKYYASPGYVPAEIQPGDFNTTMPWMLYGTMDEDDLRAIYAYLWTVKPVRNSVVKFTK